MLKTGEKAPDFTLPDQDGDAVSLTDLVGNGPLVVYFYPADFTPGCTKEACSIRDIHAELAAAGLTVVGISPQDSESHQRFAAKYRLPYRLLADPDKQAIRAWGVDGPMGVGVRRATFLVGANGVVEDMVLADLRIGRHEAFLKRAIAKAA